jgi:putative SOS response-associated peptidase YedK
MPKRAAGIRSGVQPRYNWGMCGRYVARRIDFRRFGVEFEEPWFEEFSEHGSPMRFNIAPSLEVPVVRTNSAGARIARLVRWGLVPSWTKGKPKVQPINAKCETAATSGMFRQAMGRRRCLVPADGFYEWRGKTPPKQPYFIHMKDDEPFAFAGLWERWKPAEDAEPVDTFTILTTDANDLMRPIHNRMPVILNAADYQRWLDRELPAQAVADLLKPYPSELMTARTVSTKVNNARNAGPELIEPESA